MVHLCPGEGFLSCNPFDGSITSTCVGFGRFVWVWFDPCHEFDVVEELCVEVLCLFFAEEVRVQ